MIGRRLHPRRPVGAVLCVRVTKELAIAVDELASRESVNMSDVVRAALEEFVTKGGWDTTRSASSAQSVTLYHLGADDRWRVVAS